MHSFSDVIHGSPAHSFNAVLARIAYPLLFKAGSTRGSTGGTGGQTAHVPAGSAQGGQFTTGPNSAGSGMLATLVGKDGKRTLADGTALPAHVAGLRIPPAWKNVVVSAKAGHHLEVQGVDTKGRRVTMYSAQHSAAAAESKFARISALNEKAAGMHAENEALRESANPRTAAAADASALIMHTGIRPGSETDTGAKVKAYGATTLEGRHVVTGAGGETSLRFVGKKGVSINIPVHDKGIAAMLQGRATASGASGQLFPGLNETHLSDHVHSLGGGSGFKTKDFRTLLGTRTAMDEVAKMPAPTTAKEYQASVMAVGKAVSAKLGNTPTVALESYINPTVFGSWAHARRAA